jgi:hypothetical protein
VTLSGALRNRITTTAGVALILALGVYLCFPLLRCVDSCFVDYFEVHDAQTAHFEMPDVRLNSWILGWVRHILFSNPASLFDTNAFYPAKNTLSGSEHMLGVALQTLPFHPFSGGAVMLHQTALILSFLLLGVNTFVLVRWMTGSSWAAFLSGAVAPFMPWRVSELGHLQLLSVQWLPLVWLFALRVVTGERPRRDSLWLAVVLGIQVLSSFYLAYMALFSTGLLAIALLVAYRPPRSTVYRLAGAIALPAALVALTAIPYVSRFSAYRFSEASTTPFVTSPDLVLSMLAPPLSLRADVADLMKVTYRIPLAVLLYTALALGWLQAAPADAGRDRRLRVLTVALVVTIAGAFVLMLGRETQLADVTIKLPAHWLAQIVPGFSQMRAEFRWAILIGTACPVLAGLGIARVERSLGRLASGYARAWATWVARIGTAALFAVNVSWFQLPARDAWKDSSDILNAHRALAELEPGPVVEIPWQIHRISTATNGSKYMLASSLHWWPMLNGYTAYVPDTYHVVQRLAQSLPEPRAIDYLRRLTGLRWIIVHPDRVGPRHRQPWLLAERSGTLRLAVARPDFRIYEVPAAPTNQSWLPALLAASPGPTTMTGLSRAAVPVPEEPGTLRVEAPGLMRYDQTYGVPCFVPVSVENPSETPWPGLDIQTEGLVQLRYRFFDAAGEMVREDTASFDMDLPPKRAITTRALIRPPAITGHFRVRFDVVQRVGGELRDLRFPVVAGEVAVTRRPPLPGRLESD